MARSGKFVIIAGPSGVGKGTVAKYIVENYDGFVLSVSATTRSPRPGEIDGKDYHFVSKPLFEEYIAQGKMLEWALVHGENYYGTLKDEAEALIGTGVDVILEIDLQGARQVKDSMPNVISIFLSPPSYEELRHRLETRGTDSESDREKRLKTAEIELAAQQEFDVVFVNDEVSICAQKVVEWVHSH